MTSHFSEEHQEAPGHSWTLEVHDLERSSLEALAQELAASIVRRRCALCPHHFQAWADSRQGIAELPESSKRALLAFLRPAVGTPDAQKPVDHVQGFVAQELFRFVREQHRDEEQTIRLIMPGVAPTDPGGDALLIHRQPDKTLLFRLWEIKKHTGSARVSRTLGHAYTQLERNAEEYLARYVVIGQEESDTEVAAFYGQLIDLWVEASPQAAAGVAIALSQRAVPSKCFQRFGSRFSRFASPPRLRGILTAVGDLPALSEAVKVALWTGL